MSTGITRRKFIGKAAAISTPAIFNIVPGHALGGPKATSSSDHLRIAGIGCGNHAAFLFSRFINHNNRDTKMVALCDIDLETPKKLVNRFNGKTYPGVFQTWPNEKTVPRFSDYNAMLNSGIKIDAVLIATPDHQHMPVAMAAMKKGIHVYCEKNLGVNIYEVREASQYAAANSIVTQAGIGNHPRTELDRITEAVQNGVIGQVHTVNMWCDDEWISTNPSEKDISKRPWPPRKVGKLHYTKASSDRLDLSYKGPYPDGLDDDAWTAWLGPAKHRPYPGPGRLHTKNWRAWWDFGGGRLADIGCHALDWVFTPLKLKYPLSAEAEGRFEAGKERAADWLKAKWKFPARENMDPVTVNWYDGNTRPEDSQYIIDIQKRLDMEHGVIGDPSSNEKHHGDGWARASMFIGTKGILVVSFYPTRWRLFPLEHEKNSTKFDNFNYKLQDPNGLVKISRELPNYQAFIKGVKDSNPDLVSSGFKYSGPLSETVLLAIAAYRTGKKLEWDPRHLKAIGTPEADKFLKGEYREGWRLPIPKTPDENYPVRKV